MKRLKDLIVPDKPLYEKTKVGAVRLTIHSKDIATRTKQILGMKGNLKSKEARMPDVPADYLKHFVRGLIDGDGTIDTTKGYRGNKVYIGPRVRILGGYEFLRQLVEQIRLQVPNGTKAVTKKGKANVYYVTYNFSVAKTILKWCYENSNIHLYRKCRTYKALVGEDQDIV